MKILLLEDDYSLNESIKELIESYSHEVDSFFDGLSAYEAIGGEYDLYILDVNTPKVDGHEVLTHIKAINPFSKVIMISAIIDIEKIKQAYELGCDDYIKKPFDTQELILKIQKFDSDHKIKRLRDNIAFCLNTKNLFVDGDRVSLSKNEKMFLYLLVQNHSLSVSHQQIEDFVYDGESKSFNAVRSMVKRLRKKIPRELIHYSVNEGYFLS